LSKTDLTTPVNWNDLTYSNTTIAIQFGRKPNKVFYVNPALAGDAAAFAAA
jgi:hypothetical protein